MTTLTIEIPEKAEKCLSDLIVQLGGKVVNIDKDKKLSKAAKKLQILDDFEESINFIKLHREGKVEAKTVDQLLNEL